MYSRAVDKRIQAELLAEDTLGLALDRLIPSILAERERRGLGHGGSPVPTAGAAAGSVHWA